MGLDEEERLFIALFLELENEMWSPELHYPSDVGAGALIGTMFAVMIHAV
jgi:hypothetical protein